MDSTRTWEIPKEHKILCDGPFFYLVMTKVAERMCPIAEVAYTLGFSTAWVKRHLNEFPRWIRASDGQIRIPASSVNAWIDSHQGLPASRPVFQRPAPVSLPTLESLQLDPDSELARKILGRHKA